MAQNITIMGASYSAVPAVTLPKTGGGTARFDDATVTTATASDVASGKIFLASDGTITTGTASGGGGASNVVVGEFTTSATTGAAQEITIPYTGSGHPNLIAIYASDGFHSGSSLYGITHQYATIQIEILRSDPSVAATYSGSGTNNTGYVSLLYKGSSTSNTTAARSNGAAVFTSSAATAATGTSVRMSSNKKMSIFVSSSSYGFLASTKYKYVIIYSS